jgi:hypothetical protein
METYQQIGVRSFGRGIFHKEPVSGASLGNKRIRWIEPDDLVFNNVFAWEGAVALASFAERGMCGSHRFMTYVPTSDDIDVRYLLFFFISEEGRRLLAKASPGSAGRNRTLAIARFEALEVPVPSPEEQSAHVKAIEGQRAVTQRLQLRLDEYEQQRRRLLRALTAASAGVSPERRAWQRVTLDDVLAPGAEATTVDISAEYPNIGVLSFARGLFAKPPILGSETSAKTLFRIKAGQFLYSRLFAFEGAYAVVPERFDRCFVSNEFPSFDVDAERVDPRFLQAYFRWPGVWDEIAAGSKGLGVRRQRVQPEQLLAHTLLLPPLDEQQRIGRVADGLDRVGHLRGRMHDLARALDASFLNSAFPVGERLSALG